MTNRNERIIVERIDRDKAWSAERGRIAAEAEEHISAFMAPFTGPEEQAVAADALARAIAPIVTRCGGSSRAATRFAAEAGRAEVLPVVRFTGRRP